MINLRNALMTGERTPTAKEYVQDGLVAMWDGIENAGWGKHDESTHPWKELAQNIGILTNPVLSFGPDYAIFNGEYIITDLTWTYSNMTCEICFEPSLINSNRTPISSTNRGGWSIQWENQKCFFAARYNNAYQLIYSTYGLGNLYAYQATVGSNGMRLWNKGVLVGLKSNVTSVQPQEAYDSLNYRTSLRIAANSLVGAYPFYGNMKYCRIYSRELSDSELLHNRSIDRVRFNLPDAT